MHMLLQARVEREKHFEASLKSPDGIVVPREFLQHTQHAAPASARTNKFHIRGYKGTAFYHFSTKSRVFFLNIHIYQTTAVSYANCFESSRAHKWSGSFLRRELHSDQRKGPHGQAFGNSVRN